MSSAKFGMEDDRREATWNQTREAMSAFTILSRSATSSARLGKFTIARSGQLIQTPHYLANTSRGVVPHISPDTLASKMRTVGMYVSLEDFLEKASHNTPPIQSLPNASDHSTLRIFCALPDAPLLVLGPRRVPPLACPKSNTPESISICTSVGFQQLDIDAFVDTTQALGPDIIISMADLPHERPSVKRVEKMGERTESWLRRLLDQKPRAQVFAPILPVAAEMQAFYLNTLIEARSHGSIHGLVLSKTDAVNDIPEDLSSLARLSLTPIDNPHAILRNIAQGIDLIMPAFVSAATDAGIALDFQFPATRDTQGSTPIPLALNMWDFRYATDLQPLVRNCACYTCTQHHRAYIQHLLSAKEMLAWVLLQVHNHHIVDMFFEGVRQSISDGNFDRAREQFERAYDSELPSATGLGPRVRGYQFRANGQTPHRRNPRAFGRLDDTVLSAPEATSSEV